MFQCLADAPGSLPHLPTASAQGQFDKGHCGVAYLQKPNQGPRRTQQWGFETTSPERLAGTGTSPHLAAVTVQEVPVEAHSKAVHKRTPVVSHIPTTNAHDDLHCSSPAWLEGPGSLYLAPRLHLWCLAPPPSWDSAPHTPWPAPGCLAHWLGADPAR